MKSRTNKFAAAVLATALAFGVAGCDSGDGGGDTGLIEEDNGVVEEGGDDAVDETEQSGY